MKTSFKTVTSVIACALLTAGISSGAFGQATPFPSKPIRIVVGTVPGGGIDIVARLLAQKISELDGNPVIVENRPGASTTIGANTVAKAPADGYTLFMASTSFAVAGGLYKNLPYDTLKDFAPVTLVASGPLVLGVNPSNPARNLKELIAWAKAKPGKPIFGSAGAGTSVHLAGELFRMSAGFEYVHVPYKGGAPATADMMGGHVDMVFDVVVSILPHIKAGKARAIAVTGLQRTPLLPEVPTMAESGLPGFEVAGWYGLLAPAGTPQPIVARLHQMTVKALGAPDLRARLTSLGSDAVGDGPERWGPYLQSEFSKWSKVIQQAGIQPE